MLSLHWGSWVTDWLEVVSSGSMPTLLGIYLFSIYTFVPHLWLIPKHDSSTSHKTMVELLCSHWPFAHQTFIYPYVLSTLHTKHIAIPWAKTFHNLSYVLLYLLSAYSS